MPHKNTKALAQYGNICKVLTLFWSFCNATTMKELDISYAKKLIKVT
jgi:hypothetical protein